MRSWRLPDGSLLVEVVGSYELGFHHLRDDRLVRSYLPRIADDCELMYVYGHQVVEDRLEHMSRSAIRTGGWRSWGPARSSSSGAPPGSATAARPR